MTASNFCKTKLSDMPFGNLMLMIGKPLTDLSLPIKVKVGALSSLRWAVNVRVTRDNNIRTLIVPQIF